MRRTALSLTACIAGLAWLAPAQAQLVLPGAATPTPAGASLKPAAVKTPKKAGSSSGPESGGVAATRAPAEEALADRQFQRNGSAGVMAIERPQNALEISKLVLVGYQIAAPTELCRVEVGGGKVSLKRDQRYKGLISYQAEFEACPFALDVLDGAVRVRGKLCEFKAADCNADPGGVWGPPGASIGDAESKEIEKLRGKADKDARAGFRAVLNKAGRDKALSQQIVREQASFSSLREETCRDYAREDKHGFCSSRITQARAVELSAQLHPEAGDPDKTAKVRPAPRKKPRPAKLAAPTQAAPGPQ